MTRTQRRVHAWLAQVLLAGAVVAGLLLHALR